MAASVATGDDECVKTVLIVDDHPSFRATARAVLEAEGYTVVGEAELAETAVEAARRQRPDIVVLDVELPDGSGFDVAERLTRNGSAFDVVLVSSRDYDDVAPFVSGCGACGFVPKDELSGARIRALTE